METIRESEVYKKLKADLKKKKEVRFTLPLWLEVLLCVLPLIVVNVVVQHIVLERHINKNEVSQYEAILKNAVAAFGSRLNHMQESDIELNDILEGKSSMVIPISEQSAGMDYEDADGNSAGTMYYRFYVYTGDGEIQNCDPETGTVNAGDRLFAKELTYIQEAVSSDDVIFERFKMDGCDYMAAFLSISTSGKNVYYNGKKLTDARDTEASVVFCSITDRDAIVDLQHGSVMNTTTILSVGFTVMLAILAVLLIRELSSLKLMQSTMDEIMAAESDGDEEDGRVTLIDKHFREPEIEDLVSVFNRMAGNIRVNLKRTRRLTEMFEPFVPEKLLKMFGKSDIRDVRVGDSMEVDGELVYIRFRDSVPQERRILLMSELGEALIDILQSHRGMVLNFDANTMIIIFPETASHDVKPGNAEDGEITGDIAENAALTDAAETQTEGMAVARPAEEQTDGTAAARPAEEQTDGTAATKPVEKQSDMPHGTKPAWRASEGLACVTEAYEKWFSGYDEDPGTVFCAERRVVSVKLLGNDERMQLYVSEEDLAPVRKLFRSAADGEHGPIYVL